MRSKITKLFWRLLFIPVNACFVLQVFSILALALNSIVYFSTRGDNDYAVLRYEVRDAIFLGFSLVWIIALFAFEIANAFLANFRFRRTLVNLRFAPFFILFFSFVITTVFDFGMIEYSKWQIRRYLFDGTQTVVKPEISLHNNYRGWCGNGYPAQENYLYFDAASAGFTSDDPYVRSRSLLMAAKVQDWLNGGDERFDEFLTQSCRSAGPIVLKTADDYLRDVKSSNCTKYLSSK